MREITLHRGVPGINDNIKIVAGDKTPGGAPWQYKIGDLQMGTFNSGDHYLQLLFPTGSHDEITNEVLLAVLIDRLEGFQTGPYPCPQNEDALNLLRVALNLLKDRDADAREKAQREAESKSIEDDGR